MSFFDDIAGGRDLLRRSILRLRRLFLPATGGLHIGDNTLDAEADSGGNIDPFWKRADGTSANLSTTEPTGTAGGELGGTYPNPTVDSTHSGSAHHNESHTVASHSDTTATGAELETLTDSSDADSLHTHSFVSILDRDLDQVDVVSSTTETTLYSHSIPADTLGSTGGVRMTVSGDLLVNTAGNMALKVKLGSTTIFSRAGINLADIAIRYGWIFEAVCMNTTTSAQQWYFKFDTTIGVILGDSVNAMHAADIGTSAEDTTGALTLDFTIQWTASSASLSMRKETAILELLP